MLGLHVIRSKLLSTIKWSTHHMHCTYATEFASYIFLSYEHGYSDKFM